MSDIYNIDVITVRSWLDANEAIIIDVREPNEYLEGHIEGAINIPLSGFADQIEQIKNLSAKKIGKKIVLQCKAGIRSMRACQLLQEDGFAHDVWNLEGGIIAWQET